MQPKEDQRVLTLGAAADAFPLEELEEAFRDIVIVAATAAAGLLGL